MANPPLFTPINFENLGTTTTTTTAPPASNSSTQNAVNNEASGLNSLLNLATQGAQIASAVNYQRQQSGAAGRRQSRVAQCGRRPLIGRRRKDEYRKCIAEYNAAISAPIGNQGGGGDENKNLGDGDSGGGSSMKFVWIGLGVLVLGGIAFMALRKK